MTALKEIKRSIVSVQGTRKITSAMEMVASAKMHKGRERMERMWAYRDKLYGILNGLLGEGESAVSPYMAGRPETRRAAIVAFSSNSSLCGAFNANVVTALDGMIAEYGRVVPKKNLVIVPVGRKVSDAVRKRGFQVWHDYSEMTDKPSYEEVAVLVDRLLQLFMSEKIDRVELLYHHYKSVASQTLVRETLLPFPAIAGEGGAPETDYILEPSREALLRMMLPRVIVLKFYTALLESHVSENAARMVAMQTATNNAEKLIREKNILYNKFRQQSITSELLDMNNGMTETNY